MAKLRPRARIIRTIGDQLISGPEAALIELVKNAYDADSFDIRIKISPPNPDCPLGVIAVKDTGHGMTYDDVINRWFEPATDEKLKRAYSPGGRRMLGAKGIGRFAASRLGSKTILQSIAIRENLAGQVLVQINWDDFSAEQYLEDIDIAIRTIELDPKTGPVITGTQLIITDLRDIWSRKRLANLIRELRRVASPNETNEKFQIHLDLDDFTSESVGFDGGALFQELNFDAISDEIPRGKEEQHLIIPFRIQEHADYRLIGDFDSQGSFSGSFTVCRGDNVAEAIHVPAPPLTQDETDCGPLHIRVNVYDREADAIADLFTRMGLNFENIGVRAARQILTDNAGIAIFRNGFRIRPYGEPENDWLELERMRVQDPSRKLGLSQVSGRVNIQSEELSGLVERSSREGLEHNGEFDRLKVLMLGVLVHIEQRRVGFREKAGLSRKPSADVSQVKDLAALHAVSSAVTKLPLEFQESVRKAIAKDSSALASSLEEMDEYQKLLQSRASLGLVVAQVIHEGRRILNPMSTAAKSIYEFKGYVLEVSKRGDTYRKQFPLHAQILQDGAKSMSKLFKMLDPVSGRKRGRPSAFSIKEAVQSGVNLFADALETNHIVIDVDDIEHLKAYGFAEDFQAALLNVLENAIHWLSASQQQEKSIRILAKKFNDKLRVAIINNGPLIDPSYLPRLFQPGFSLKSSGTGLGLSIAREACRASKGDLLHLDDAPETCFIILFPAENN
jgi:signal transduction histidine kinase